MKNLVGCLLVGAAAVFCALGVGQPSINPGVYQITSFKDVKYPDDDQLSGKKIQIGVDAQSIKISFPKFSVYGVVASERIYFQSWARKTRKWTSVSGGGGGSFFGSMPMPAPFPMPYFEKVIARSTDDSIENTYLLTEEYGAHKTTRKFLRLQVISADRMNLEFEQLGDPNEMELERRNGTRANSVGRRALFRYHRGTRYG